MPEKYRRLRADAVVASVRACPEVATQARAESGGRGIPGSAFAALGHDPLRLSVDISRLYFRPRQRRVPEPSSRSHLRRLAEGPRRPTRKLPPSSVRPGILAERVVVSRLAAAIQQANDEQTAEAVADQR